MVTVGQSASRTRTVTADDIAAFARISGDDNPLHLDEAYAATTRFGRCIAHGALTAGLVSAVLANDLPGPGTIFLRQSSNFRAPVFPGDAITARVEVRRLWRKRYAALRTECRNQNGEVVLEGWAMVLLPTVRVH